ncbi:MAG: hypothetical protein EBR30_28600 [Cytophagia bacterium]|nr:hypothetical protein [Cytophagia bacterium]
MKAIRLLFLTLFLSTSSALRAQDVDSLLLGDDLDFLISGDSLSVFALIDSLLNAGIDDQSQLAFRLGYNSNVIAAGRTLGIENFGLAPGISYYHKSGLFADVSGFWSKDFDPSYYLTIASAGYSKVVSKKFSVMATYDRYFYNTNTEDAYIPYKNAASLNGSFDHRWLNTGLTYSFYFGDKTVQRIVPSVGATFEIKRKALIKRVAILPTFYLLLGDEIFYSTEVLIPRTRQEALYNFRRYGKVFPTIVTEKRELGLMNYSFTLPLSISIGKTNLLITYVYSIPKALPSETLTFSESSFITASLSWLPVFKPRKSAWQ